MTYDALNATALLCKHTAYCKKSTAFPEATSTTTQLHFTHKCPTISHFIETICTDKDELQGGKDMEK